MDYMHLFPLLHNRLERGCPAESFIRSQRHVECDIGSLQCVREGWRCASIRWLMNYRLELLFVARSEMACCRTDRQHGDRFSMRPPKHPVDKCRWDGKNDTEQTKETPTPRRGAMLATRALVDDGEHSQAAMRQAAMRQAARWRGTHPQLQPKNASGKTQALQNPSRSKDEFSLVDAPWRRALGAGRRKLVGL